MGGIAANQNLSTYFALDLSHGKLREGLDKETFSLVLYFVSLVIATGGSCR